MSINGSFHTSGASIARGIPRTIGQKPEPTIRKGMVHIRLPSCKRLLRKHGTVSEAD